MNELMIALATKFDAVSPLFAQLNEENRRETINRIADVLGEGREQSVAEQLKLEFDQVVDALGSTVNIETVFLTALERTKVQNALKDRSEALFGVITSQVQSQSVEIMKELIDAIKTLKPFNNTIKDHLLIDFTLVSDFDFSSLGVDEKGIVYGLRSPQNCQLSAGLVAEFVKRYQIAIEASKLDSWSQFCSLWTASVTEIEDRITKTLMVHNIDELVAKYSEICLILKLKWTALDSEKREKFISCVEEVLGWQTDSEPTELSSSAIKTAALLINHTTNSEFSKIEPVPVDPVIAEQRKQSKELSVTLSNSSVQVGEVAGQQINSDFAVTDLEATKTPKSAITSSESKEKTSVNKHATQESLQTNPQDKAFIAESGTQISGKVSDVLKEQSHSNSLSLKVCSPEFQSLRQRIEKNLQRMFDFYSKSRLKPDPSKKEFDAYQQSLKQMRLREFMDFCADFGVQLYTCPKKNSQGLQILFKLITTKTGLTFPKFINILRHVALKIKEEQNSQSLTKSNNALQQENSEKTPTVDPETEQQRLPTCESEDYFGKPEKHHPSIEFDENMYESQETKLQQSTLNEPKQTVIKPVPVPVFVHKCTAPALTTPEELEECFVGYMIALGIDNPAFCQQVTHAHRPREQRDESPSNLRPLGSQELSELTFQPNISQSQPYDPAASKRLPKIQVRAQSGVREKSQAAQKDKLKVSNKNPRKSVKAPLPPHKDVYEKLYLQGVSKKGFQQHLKEISQKKELQTKAIAQPVRKTSHPQIRTDSYAAKENFKKQAHFLQHINWEIVSKMSFSELAMQMQEKVGADNFTKLKKTVEATNKLVKGAQLIKMDNQEGKEEMSFQKHSKFLNYGKR